MPELDTVRLSLPEGRRVGQPGHAKALEYLVQRMTDTGLEPFEGDTRLLPYVAGGIEFTNLAGMIPGSDPGTMPILLGAHYDSAIDAPSADDNAVSVALLLDSIPRIAGMKLRRNVVVAFFDAEEKPFFGTDGMGSVRFHRDHCRGLDFACVIVLDMIGHPFELMMPVLDRTVRRIRKFLFILGSESHTALPGIVESAASRIRGLRPIPTLNRYVGDRSDHMAFRKAGQPYLFISRGRGRHSHTPRDTVEWIEFDAVRRIGDLLLELVRLIDVSFMEEGREGTDPFECEIRMLKRAAGPLLPLILPFLGRWSGPPRTRADLDWLAARLGKSLAL